jgi:HEAT repeat protein
MLMLRWLRFWDRRRNPPKERPRPARAAQPERADLPLSLVRDEPSDLPPEHAALLRALEDPSPAARDEAGAALARVGAPVVPALADALSHEAAHVRQAAALALGDMGPTATPALAALVRAAIDRDEGVRRAASGVLARVDPAWAIAADTRRALPALVEGLRSGLPWVNQSAAALLLRVGRPAVPALVGLLADWEKEAHRLAAIRLLEQLGPSAAEAAPQLADVMAGSDTTLRLAAAEALTRLGTGAAAVVPALIRTLSDWSPPVRRAAARALGAAGPPAGHAVPSLLGLLADWDDGAREAAAAALAAVGEAAVPLLALVLGERDLRRAGQHERYREEVDRLWRRMSGPEPDRAWRELAWAARDALRERVEAVHQGAAAALGRIGPAAAPAVPVLARALAEDGLPPRVAAARALGGIGPEARPALPPLVAALVKGEVELRKAAAEALPLIDADWRDGSDEAGGVLWALVGRLRDRGPRAAEAADALTLVGAEAVPALVRGLASDDAAVCEAAALALGRIGPPARCAVSALTATLRDRRGGVREAAEQALARLAPERAGG